MVEITIILILFCLLVLIFCKPDSAEYAKTVHMYKKIIRDRYLNGFEDLTPAKKGEEIKSLEKLMNSSKEYYPDDYRAFRKACKYYLVEMRFAVKMQAARIKANKIIKKMEEQSK